MIYILRTRFEFLLNIIKRSISTGGHHFDINNSIMFTSYFHINDNYRDIEKITIY